MPSLLDHLMIITGPIEKFFRAPGDPWPQSDTGEGLLYHMRRDLTRFYGKETQLRGKAKGSVWLPMMGMLACMDYLSQTYTGQQGRKAFVDGVRLLGGLTKDRGEALYQLRCGLMHEISIHATEKRTSTVYKFYVDDTGHNSRVVLRRRNAAPVKRRAYTVYFWGMKALLLKMIGTLKRSCTSPQKRGRVAAARRRVIERSGMTIIETAS